MLEEYVFRGTEKLRCGYTTGSCAAGAAMAAAKILLTGEVPEYSELLTPKGILLKLGICDVKYDEKYASCAVIKDSGDDPDITNGMAVYAKVRFAESGIKIIGGKGIGIVTKAGLDQPVGEYAINSVPRKMITQAVKQICEENDYNGGLIIEISVPDGEKTALKTYNPRMGITGGISIIGTSGIVEPMSNTAIIDTIRAEAKIRKNEGMNTLLLSLGNYSDSFIQQNMPFLPDKNVKCSNFIGEGIEIALELGFSRILITGHIGKMVKLGAGIMNTHSAQADARMEVLVTCGLLAGADCDTLKKITDCATVDSALDILKSHGFMEKTLEKLITRIEYYLNAKVRNSVEIGAVIFSFKHDFTLKTANADKLINSFTEVENG